MGAAEFGRRLLAAFARVRDVRSRHGLQQRDLDGPRSLFHLVPNCAPTPPIAAIGAIVCSSVFATDQMRWGQSRGLGSSSFGAPKPQSGKR
jgi:hypothetical protein